MVNTAGRLTVSKIEELPDDNWEDDITVNLTAPFMVIKQLLGPMKEKGWGRILIYLLLVDLWLYETYPATSLLSLVKLD